MQNLEVHPRTRRLGKVLWNLFQNISKWPSQIWNILSYYGVFHTLKSSIFGDIPSKFPPFSQLHDGWFNQPHDIPMIVAIKSPSSHSFHMISSRWIILSHDINLLHLKLVSVGKKYSYQSDHIPIIFPSFSKYIYIHILFPSYYSIYIYIYIYTYIYIIIYIYVYIICIFVYTYTFLQILSEMPMISTIFRDTFLPRLGDAKKSRWRRLVTRRSTEGAWYRTGTTRIMVNSQCLQK